MAAIYVLKNTVNNKLYVGQTTQTFRARARSHRSHNHNSMVIDRAINKYGWNNFEQHVFYVPESWLDYFETEMIKHLNSLARNGYNVDDGGNKNKHLAESTRALQSKSKKGKFCDENGAWKGNNVLAQTLRRREISAARRELNPIDFRKFMDERTIEGHRKAGLTNKSRRIIENIF